jgi:hypothetical protein
MESNEKGKEDKAEFEQGGKGMIDSTLKDKKR